MDIKVIHQGSGMMHGVKQHNANEDDALDPAQHFEESL
jgi:hypothetical protein